MPRSLVFAPPLRHRRRFLLPLRFLLSPPLLLSPLLCLSLSVSFRLLSRLFRLSCRLLLLLLLLPFLFSLILLFAMTIRSILFRRLLLPWSMLSVLVSSSISPPFFRLLLRPLLPPFPSAFAATFATLMAPPLTSSLVLHALPFVPFVSGSRLFFLILLFTFVSFLTRLPVCTLTFLISHASLALSRSLRFSFTTLCFAVASLCTIPARFGAPLTRTRTSFVFLPVR